MKPVSYESPAVTLRKLYAFIHFVDEVKPANLRVSVHKSRLNRLEWFTTAQVNAGVRRRYRPDYAGSNLVFSLHRP